MGKDRVSNPKSFDISVVKRNFFIVSSSNRMYYLVPPNALLSGAATEVAGNSAPSYRIGSRHSRTVYL